MKQAAARANKRLGYLSPAKADAIDRVCTRVATEPHFPESFVVDAIQAGAGTSTNMNADEVIANVALELMGEPLGHYAALHPNDDVNMAQSTNDAYPTALRLAVIFATQPLIAALDELAYALRGKAVEFAEVLKMGRTQLMDAVPMTLGQEFDGFHATIKEDVSRLTEIVGLFRIEADRERCRSLVHGSIGLVTALVPALGYEACSRVAKPRAHREPARGRDRRRRGAAHAGPARRPARTRSDDAAIAGAKGRPERLTRPGGATRQGFPS